MLVLPRLAARVFYSVIWLIGSILADAERSPAAHEHIAS